MSLLAFREGLSALLLLSGAFFFLAGTVGLLRFPDLLTRLHALTKADNLGLGFVVLGLAVVAPKIATVAKLGVIWGLVALSSSISAQLIAGARDRTPPEGGAA